MIGLFWTPFQAYWTRSNRVPKLEWSFKSFHAYIKWSVQGVYHNWNMFGLFLTLILDAFRNLTKAGTIVRIVPMIVPGIFEAFKMFIIIGIHIFLCWTPFKVYWICSKAGTIVPIIVPGIYKAFKVLISIGAYVWPILNIVSRISDAFKKFSKAGTIVRIFPMTVPDISKAFKMLIIIEIHVFNTVQSILDAFKNFSKPGTIVRIVPMIVPGI